MDPLLTTAQTLAALRRLEPKDALTYRQLRDLEFRGCVTPRMMSGAKAPRVFDTGDLLLLRLIARLQADEMLSRWQAWSVVAHLREDLREVLLEGTAKVLLIQGAVGRLVTARDAASLTGVPVELSDIGRGVREAMRRYRGDIWNGWMWVPARDAAAQARKVVEA